MAKKQTPKNKARQEPGFRTLGMRVSVEYAEWLAKGAEHDHRTIASLIEKAVADYLKGIGFKEPAPDRIP